MRYRPLGRTGLQVSEIGFGAWGIGGWSPDALSYGRTDDERSLAALDCAIERGITFIDTSSLYGLGHSERLIGQAIRGRRERVVIATKAGHAGGGRKPDFSPEALRRSLEGSLHRLNIDHIDLLQLHGPSIADLRSNPAILDTLAGFQQEGVIRAFGVSASSPTNALTMVEEWRVPVIQVNLSMLDLRAVECGLLDAVARAGTGLIARTPLCFGFLTGEIAEDTVFPPEDHRSRWNGPQVARWSQAARRALASAGAWDRETCVQAALRFCLSFPEVSAVIPGLLTPRDVTENITASEFGPYLPADFERILDVARRCSQDAVSA
ncbi:aldo/keto reductase [Azospirillum largimobile]